MAQRALDLGVGCTSSWSGARSERQSDVAVQPPAAWPSARLPVNSSPSSLPVRLLGGSGHLNTLPQEAMVGLASAHSAPGCVGSEQARARPGPPIKSGPEAILTCLSSPQKDKALDLGRQPEDWGMTSMGEIFIFIVALSPFSLVGWRKGDPYSCQPVSHYTKRKNPLSLPLLKAWQGFGTTVPIT